MKDPMLVTMQGPGGIRSLSNFEAGLATVGVIAKAYPGITWGQLFALGRPNVGAMGWNPLGDLASGIYHGVGSLKDGIGDILHDSVSMFGGIGGSGLRLITDKDVLAGASELAAAYASGGITEAAKGALGGGDIAGVGDALNDFLSVLGLNSKKRSAAGGGEAMPKWVVPVSVGVGGLLLVMLLRGGKR